jgi:hypothetical protein
MCSTLNSYSRNKDDSVEPATHVAQKERGKNDRNGEAMAMGTVDRGVMLSDRSRVPRIDKLFRRSANARAQHPRPLRNGRLHARQHDYCDCVSCIGNVIYLACSSSHGYALDYNDDRFAMLVIFRSPRGRTALRRHRSDTRPLKVTRTTFTIFAVSFSWRFSRSRFAHSHSASAKTQSTLAD